MKAEEVFRQNNGDVTKAYYAELNATGIEGQLAVALFRAQKRSTAAKKYRGGGFRRVAYDVKNWSMSEICRIAPQTTFMYGWKVDPSVSEDSPHRWVLYVDLPQGQVSFHSPARLEGPDYPGDWDGIKNASEGRICEFCAAVCSKAKPAVKIEVLA